MTHASYLYGAERAIYSPLLQHVTCKDGRVVSNLSPLSSLVCVILCKVEVVSIGKLHLLLIRSVELPHLAILVYVK